MNKPIIEATCVVDGVEYHAVTAPASEYGPVCTGCVAIPRTLCCKLAQRCGAERRADRSDIIWVPA